MLGNDPWFRRWFGHSVVPINRKGWIAVTLLALASAPFLFVIYHDEPGSLPWRLASIALLALNAGFYFTIRDRIDTR